MYHDKDKGKLVLSNPIDFMTEWDPIKIKRKNKNNEKTQDELAAALIAFANIQNANIDEKE